MIEIHILYMSHGYHSTGEGGGGHSTMAVVRRPPHSQDIMFVTMKDIRILHMSLLLYKLLI